MDAGHALHKELALVLAVDEMLADGAYIVDDSHHGGKVAAGCGPGVLAGDMNIESAVCVMI